MKQLSIDVVLLPPQEVIEWALQWNTRLLEVYPDRIRMGRESGVPHISLAMACIADTELPEAEKRFAAIAADTHLLNLHIPGIKIVHNAAGEPISSFDIRPDPPLRSLHERVVGGLSGLVCGPATRDSLHHPHPGGVSPSTLQWISDYLTRHSFDAFWPHITLGYGQLDEDFPACDFSTSRLAVFHLGNHCTCQDLLLEFELKP